MFVLRHNDEHNWDSYYLCYYILLLLFSMHNACEINVVEIVSIEWLWYWYVQLITVFIIILNSVSAYEVKDDNKPSSNRLFDTVNFLKYAKTITILMKPLSACKHFFRLDGLQFKILQNSSYYFYLEIY